MTQYRGEAVAPDRPATQAHARVDWASALVVALVAFNLRPALTGVGPVLPEIMHTTGLDPGGASLLTTLPILCLGVFGAAAPVLARRLGLERAIAAILLALAAGLLLRAIPGLAALFAGSLLAGAAIGVGNVLMPALLKRVPGHPALLTGLYSMTLCLGAAVAAGIVVPLARAAGGSWRFALAAWAVPAGLAWVATILGWRRWRTPDPTAAAGPPAPAGPPAAAGAPAAAVASLLLDPLAWHVTLFMGLQSMLAYGVFGWLAPILRSRGDSPHTAGLVVALSILAQVAAALPTPLLAARLPRQSGLAVAIAVLIVASLLGLTRLPLPWQWPLAVALGIGMGAAFALAITLIVLRGPDPDTTTRLSGMAQSIGYVLASAGPLAIGISHARGGGWHGAEVMFVLAGAGAALAGFRAGQRRHVGVATRV